MKLRQSLVIGFLFLLTACGQKTTLTYDMAIDSPDASRVMTLIQASERMIIRRLAAAQVPTSPVTTVPTGSGSGRLTMQLPNDEAAQIARKILSEPFTFEIRLEQAAARKTAGTGSLDTGNWLSTGVGGPDLEWVQVVNNPNGDVGVELIFTSGGRTKLNNVLKTNPGMSIGLFIRDLLVSKLKIQGKTLGDHVVISGIPSAKVAEIFADDVNVGLHVTFNPVN